MPRMPELSEDMSEFIKLHPFAVYTTMGQFKARFSNFNCAARTMLEMGVGHVVRDEATEERRIYTMYDCRLAVAKQKWVNDRVYAN